MAKGFKASLTAAAIKLVKQATVPAFVACHKPDPPHMAPEKCGVSKRVFVTSELHHDTDAFRMAFGAVGGMSRSRREPANRWVSGREIFRFEVNSQSIKLPDTTVLTILTLVK